MFGVPAFLPAPHFPLSFLKSRDLVLRVRSGLPGCAEPGSVGSVGRGGQPARAPRSGRHHAGPPRAHLAGCADGPLVRGLGVARRPSPGPAGRSSSRTTLPTSQPAPPAASPRQLLIRGPCLAAPRGRGPANQTRAFPAGAGQSAASVCWNRETLRGKAITKAFHCRQMLSVCADFSCF